MPALGAIEFGGIGSLIGAVSAISGGVVLSLAPPAPDVPDAKSRDDGECVDDDCAEEWREAFEICAEELSKQNPNRGLTGGHTTIQECAKGFVSERCKGNPIDWGARDPIFGSERR